VLDASETGENCSRADAVAVYLWRFQRSQAMGFASELADRIAMSEVDLHELERLLSCGCSPRTAYRILRP
jgi:hypothetical protein